VLVNLAYNSLFVLGRVIQYFFFGSLRETESKNIYDRLLHYVLFKIVFLGAILEPSSDLLVYVICFSILGFLKIFCWLTRDRFEHVSFGKCWDLTLLQDNLQPNHQLQNPSPFVRVVDVNSSPWYWNISASVHAFQISLGFTFVFRLFIQLVQEGFCCSLLRYSRIEFRLR
jgi:hypothetical protein